MSQEKDKPKICYLLGAGASYNALPLVNEVPFDLAAFKSYIINYNNKLGASKFNDLTSQLSNFQKIINETYEHHSIDTLARKYWLKNENLKANSKSINYDWYALIKNIITCWLTWRRLKGLDSNLQEYDINNKNSERLKKLKHLDPRYDAFFSAILDSNLKIPDNIKIVSWNYDLQIEQSFNFYFEGLQLKDVGNRIGIGYHKFEPGPIVKLNGSSVIAIDQIALWEQSYNENVHDVFVKALKNDFGPNVYSNIRFAWENEGMVSNYRELASKYILESSYVVIIGYSFPIFNREVDRQMFEGFSDKGVARIFIQASDEDAPRIKSQLESIQIGLSKKAEIISNLSQFFIPNEFWTRIDPNIEEFINTQ